MNMLLKEKARKVKKELRKIFPGVKFSVRTYKGFRSDGLNRIVIKSFGLCEKSFSKIQGVVLGLSSDLVFCYDLINYERLNKK